MKKATISALLVVAFSSANLFSAVPHLINYQGQLTDSSGAEVSDGDYLILFKLFDSESGGNLVWSENHASVQVSNGLFNVILGSISNLLPGIFHNADLWLEISTGATTFQPRSKIISVPYAIVAEELRLTPQTNPDSCGSASEGRIYYDILLNEPCYCNGMEWLQMDGGGPCDSVVSEYPEILVGDLVITEIMINPALYLDSEAEWFEVFNATQNTLNLRGLIISDINSSDTINSDVIMSPGDYATLSLINPRFTSDYIYSSSITFGNTSGMLSLTWNSALLDAVAYDANASWIVPTGASMNLSASNIDQNSNDVASNWCTSTVFGASGEPCNPGLPNELCSR